MFLLIKKEKLSGAAGASKKKGARLAKKTKNKKSTTDFWLGEWAVCVDQRIGKHKEHTHPARKVFP